MTSLRTQVGIVGAGPAGLMLGHLLHRYGIDSVIVEDRSQEHVIERVRAGVLEQGTVDLMHATGVGERLAREGMRHDGIYIAFDSGGRHARHRIDMSGLTGGRGITVYGQNEVVKDLIAARAATGRPTFWEVEQVSISGMRDRRPQIHCRHEGSPLEVTCDFIGGCDGFHGVCRPSIPPTQISLYERTYPFAWLGILAKAAPSSDELVYSLHERGFVERRENVIFLGPPGVGKTHLAISLAIAAAQSGRRVYYGTLADLITSLEEAQAAGRLQARLKVLTHPAVLVVDEIGYLPITRTGAMLFFQLMTRRYEHASTVLTSNKGFEEWGDIFGDDVMAAALIDRLVHHCHLVTIRGNSYRLRQHTELWQTLHAPQDPEPTARRRRARQEATTN